MAYIFQNRGGTATGGSGVVVPPSRVKAWRVVGGASCVLANTDNTGYKAWSTLEQYYVDDNSLTGLTKSNSSSDADYIAPVQDLAQCPLPGNVTAFRATYTNLASQQITGTSFTMDQTAAGVKVEITVSKPVVNNVTFAISGFPDNVVRNVVLPAGSNTVLSDFVYVIDDCTLSVSSISNTAGYKLKYDGRVILIRTKPVVTWLVTTTQTATQVNASFTVSQNKPYLNIPISGFRQILVPDTNEIVEEAAPFAPFTLNGTTPYQFTDVALKIVEGPVRVDYYVPASVIAAGGFAISPVSYINGSDHWIPYAVPQKIEGNIIKFSAFYQKLNYEYEEVTDATVDFVYANAYYRIELDRAVNFATTFVLSGFAGGVTRTLTIDPDSYAGSSQTYLVNSDIEVSISSVGNTAGFPINYDGRTVKLRTEPLISWAISVQNTATETTATITISQDKSYLNIPLFVRKRVKPQNSSAEGIITDYDSFTLMNIEPHVFVVTHPRPIGYDEDVIFGVPGDYQFANNLNFNALNNDGYIGSGVKFTSYRQ